MGWFTSEEPTIIERYGWKFKWSPLHQSSRDLDRLRHTYDVVATEALDRIDKIVPPPSEAFAPRKDIQSSYEPKDKKLQRDFFQLVKRHVDDDEKIGKLWSEINTVPEWVDWDQIERGQKVFWRYGGASLTALSYLSLLGGMASGRPVETLDRTGGFGSDVVRRRLLETTQHTLGVHKDLKSIQPGGDGWEASVRVRLLHGSVRRRILNLAEQDPKYYSIQKNGIPINDLESMGTIMTFCATLVWLGYPRQGIYLRPQETEDFLALWRWVAHIMGVPHDWLKTPAEAKAMMESLMLAEYRPTKAGAVLANNIITGLEGQPPIYPSRGFLNALTWWLNGKRLAQDLDIAKPSFYHTSLVASQCWLFMLNGYICRSLSVLDEWNFKRTRSLLYEALIENKEKGALGYKAMFAFKWIPDLLNVHTPRGAQIESRRKDSGALKHDGLERSALIMILLSFSAIYALGYGGWRLARGILMI